MAYTITPTTTPRYGASVAVSAMSNAQLAIYLGYDVSLGGGHPPPYNGLVDRLIDGRVLNGTGADAGDAAWIIQMLATGIAPVPPPVVSPGNFSFALPVMSGKLVGTMTATNAPTVWVITAITPSAAAGYFTINNIGQIRVSATGATNITAITYTLTLRASNTSGPGTGTAQIAVSPPPGVSIGIQIAGQAPNVGVNFPTAADAGDLVGAITVTTNTGAYVGVITIGGTDAGKFVLSNSGNYPCSLFVGGTAIAAGSYSISLTATP
jgi:hypothetical protein